MCELLQSGSVWKDVLGVALLIITLVLESKLLKSLKSQLDLFFEVNFTVH